VKIFFELNVSKCNKTIAIRTIVEYSSVRT